MTEIDDLIETGFAQLRGAHPKQDVGELLIASRKQDRRALAGRIGLALATGACSVLVIVLALQPSSAFAQLREAAKRTAAEPIVHLHMEGRGQPQTPADPPWPQAGPLDIWRFPDHYFRKQDSKITEQFRDGRMLCYDRRFPFGVVSHYDAGKDRFWNFDGSIGIELSSHRNPPDVRRVAGTTEYRWDETDQPGNHSVSIIRVENRSGLVDSTLGERVASNGDRSQSRTKVDYPSLSEANRGAPRFPLRLKFRRQEDLLSDFDRRIKRPDQAETVAGVRVTLFGVIIGPNVPDGLSVQVITKGGAAPDYGSGHPTRILGQHILPVKRTTWFPGLSNNSSTRFTRPQPILGQTDLLQQSEDLLTKAPNTITVQTPVWKPGSRKFIGYATFRTSKIFYNPEESVSYLERH